VGGKAGTGQSTKQLVVVDRDGTVIRQPPFDHTTGFSHDLAAVALGKRGLWGYVDRDGALLIDERFAAAQPFRDGLARVVIGGKREGIKVIGGKTGYITTTGGVAIDPEFDGAGDFGDGLAPVVIGGERLDGFDFVIGGKWGYIDRKGAIAIEPRFAAAAPFCEGLAAVLEASEHQFIDTAGRVVLRYPASANQALSLGGFHEGLAWVFRHNPSVKLGPPPERGMIEYVDRAGTIVIAARESDRFYLGDFSDGLARAYAPSVKRFGYIDRSGGFVIEPLYHGGTPFRDGRAIVLDPQGRAQIIDRDGSVMLPFSAGLHGGFPFDNGLTVMSR
jgi:hypothetical protein